jgi:hypothetical protein
MNTRLKLSTKHPQSASALEHSQEKLQDIDIANKRKKKKLSTKPTTTTTLLLKTEQQV